MSFDQILKLAAAKQHEPIKIEKKLDVPEKKGPESERLMTKKEKEDLIRRKEEERDRQLRKDGKLPPIATSTPSSVQPTKSKEKPTVAKAIPVKEPTKAPSMLAGKSVKPAAVINSTSKPIIRPDDVRETIPKASDIKRPEISKGIPNKPRPLQSTMKNPPPKQLPNPQSSRMPQGKGKSLAPAGPSRPFPPYRDIRPVGRPFKSTIFFLSRSKAVVLTHIFSGPMESDEEEIDSELEDFIDDGPDETEDYSKHIQDIFGYNRNRCVTNTHILLRDC